MTYYEYAKQNFIDNKVMAFRGKKGLIELYSSVKDEDIETLTPIFLTDKDGMRIYRRTATFILVVATQMLFDKELIVNHHISGGYFCEFKDTKVVSKEDINLIKEKMQQLVDAKLPIIKEVILTDDAIASFEEQRLLGKSELFHYRRASTVNTYVLEGIRDYFYGYMLPNTELVNVFDLMPVEGGFILQFPDTVDPSKVTNWTNQPKLAAVFKESKEWARILGVDVAAALNRCIVEGTIADLIRTQEALHEKKIAAIADAIICCGTKKVVLISGPSSSGKTTFSKRLCVQLKVNGLKPKLISMDDYFVDRELTPRDEFGEIDFESVDAIDIELFNNTLSELVDGKIVEIPSYNFKTGSREYKGNFLQLDKGDILVIEGIHGLNPKIGSSISMDQKYKIYVSALTQLNIDYHNRISTTDSRLLRRMIRDNTYRGITPEETLSRWASVRRGEEKNIFPYQEEADMMFNTVLIYELAVLKQKAEALLFGIDRSSMYYEEAKRLLKFLEYFLGTDTTQIPYNSILREFIGGLRV
ncbi:MAG: phosphoglycerate transporter [Epulopiscium sp. Nele67-Bin001]|nr:MAG: phosphoglycerate transporter [Epulopiscium sp. Nele67-Bin001]